MADEESNWSNDDNRSLQVADFEEAKQEEVETLGRKLLLDPWLLVREFRGQKPNTLRQKQFLVDLREAVLMSLSIADAQEFEATYQNLKHWIVLQLDPHHRSFFATVEDICEEDPELGSIVKPDFTENTLEIEKQHFNNA